MPKLTPEQEQDVEERTTALGMFHVAESYWRAAIALDTAKVESTHPDLPVWFLYYHAIELYLKSFLRVHGHRVMELADKFGHRTGKLRDRARELGIGFMDEDLDVLALMAETDAVIRSRYLQVGAFRLPTSEALDRTCKSIRVPVWKALKASGVPLRLL